MWAGEERNVSDIAGSAWNRKHPSGFLLKLRLALTACRGLQSDLWGKYLW